MDSSFPSSESASTDQIAELTQQVREHEATIEKLTEFLEWAASRLEEADVPPPPPPAEQIAFPADMVERQWKLTERFANVVDEWREAETPAQIARLSDEISAIRELATRWFDDELGRTPSDEEMPAGSLLSQMQHGDDRPESSGSISWAALKAEMLGEEPPPAEPEEPAAAAEEQVNLQEELQILDKRPAPVDASQAEREDWQAAIEERELYIVSLVRMLRVLQARCRGPIEDVPEDEISDEQRSRLVDLENTLHQKLRQGEVELSMERARVGRLESRIRQRESEIQRILKQRDQANGETNESDSRNRRWMRFIGRAKEDGAN
ncbi:hypothetical protein [Thalassoroseus pseudoceratinae]|uniref:hypothetical protein n=1 Tax=Thalassoroseus pseudoceratinae TaxID=2713176 RepID=UPI00141DC032|nr:hypothetical protein [Thalassoroseus pseudoceratinae]